MEVFGGLFMLAIIVLIIVLTLIVLFQTFQQEKVVSF